METAGSRVATHSVCQGKQPADQHGRPDRQVRPIQYPECVCDPAPALIGTEIPQGMGLPREPPARQQPLRQTEDAQTHAACYDERRPQWDPATAADARHAESHARHQSSLINRERVRLFAWRQVQTWQWLLVAEFGKNSTVTTESGRMDLLSTATSGQVRSWQNDSAAEQRATEGPIGKTADKCRFRQKAGRAGGLSAMQVNGGDGQLES